MNEISLTIPMDYNALTRASDMLHGLALDLNKQGGITEHEKSADFEAKTAREVDCMKKVYAAEGFVDDAAVTETEELPTPKPLAVSEIAPSVPAIASSAHTVDIDANGLPWDERIHASTKTKVVNGSWKRKRGVDDAVIADVEAELRQVMAIQSPKPVGTVTEQGGSTTVPTSDNATAEHPQATAPVAAVPTPQPAPSPAVVPATAPVAVPPVEGIATLPQLMASATSNGITPEVMQSAVLKFGLTSVALLGARPDLIPSVAAELGLAA